MAEIDNHVRGGGALVDLDDLAFELVTRTELHYFSPSQAPPFFSTAIGASFNKMRCYPCRKALFIEPPRALYWKPVARDAGELLCRPQRRLDHRRSTGSRGADAAIGPARPSRTLRAPNPVPLAGILPLLW